MERTTIRHLNCLATLINRSLKRPDEFLNQSGRMNVGHFHIEQQSELYKLVETVNDGGATRTLAYGSTARECYNAAHAWFSGYLYAENRHGQIVTMREAQRATEAEDRAR